MAVIHRNAEYRRILVVKPSSLGDVVHSLPFLNSLRECFPKAEIDWVIAKGLEGLLEGHPMISRLIIINKDLWKNISNAGETVKEIKHLFREIRDQKYDLVIDLQGLLRSGLVTMSSRAPVRIGFSEAREGSRLFYTHKIRGGRDIHAVDRYMKIAAALGCDIHDIRFPFPLPDNRRSSELLQNIGPYAVFVPGARWKTKIWPSESFGKVAAMLPMRSVIVGSPSDRSIAADLLLHAEGKAISLAGETDLKGLIDVIGHARLVITNDTGPMHIAAALNIPVVAVFGPTDPRRTGPYGRNNIILQSHSGCVPCFKRRCTDMLCMHEVTPEAVVRESNKILEIDRQ